MLRRIRWIVLALVVIGSPLVATFAWADNNDGRRMPFTPLSQAHIDYGVSQFNYGIVPRSGGGPGMGVPAPMKLMNPNWVTQIAAVFVYRRDFDPSQTEVFLGCVVKKLTPHSSLDLIDASPQFGGDFPTGEENSFFIPPGFPPRYAEVIWAPEFKVTVKGKETSRRRLADGLGGHSQGAVNTTVHHLGHPTLFSLPSNKVVPGQREAAVDCVCSQLMELGLNPVIFASFGIRCQ